MKAITCGAMLALTITASNAAEVDEMSANIWNAYFNGRCEGIVATIGQKC